MSNKLLTAVCKSLQFEVVTVVGRQMYKMLADIFFQYGAVT